jgi:uncharacterized coiled-coil protein SlyX
MEHRVTKLETDVSHIASAVDSLTEQVTELNESLARYRGAWGMLLMIGGALVTGVTVWFKFK